MPAKPSLGSSPADGRPSPLADAPPYRVFRRNPDARSGWDTEWRETPPAGMPTVRGMTELDLSSGLYDAHGVCVVLG